MNGGELNQLVWRN